LSTAFNIRHQYRENDSPETHESIIYIDFAEKYTCKYTSHYAKRSGVYSLQQGTSNMTDIRLPTA